MPAAPDQHAADGYLHERRPTRVQQYAHVAIVDEPGNVVASMGPRRPTFFRPAMKPITTPACVQDGVAARFRLAEMELALWRRVTCGIAETRQSRVGDSRQHGHRRKGTSVWSR